MKMMVRLPQPLSAETSPRTQRNGLEKCQKYKVCEDSEDQEKNGLEQSHAISIKLSKYLRTSPTIPFQPSPSASPCRSCRGRPNLKRFWELGPGPCGPNPPAGDRRQKTCAEIQTFCVCVFVCAETPNTNMYT